MVSGGYWTPGSCCWLGQCLSLPHRSLGYPKSNRMEVSLCLPPRSEWRKGNSGFSSFFSSVEDQPAELGCIHSLPEGQAEPQGLALTVCGILSPLPEAVSSPGTVVLSVTLELGHKVLKMIGAWVPSSRFRLGWRHGGQSYLWP